MSEPFRCAGALFFGIVYLAAGYGFMFHPLEIFNNKSTFIWIATTFNTGDAIMNGLWLLSGSVGFVLTGLALLLAALPNRKRISAP